MAAKEPFELALGKAGFLGKCGDRDGLVEGAAHPLDRGEERGGQTIAAQTCVGRNGEPEDIDGPLLFFCSDMARYVTGQVLMVDGGFTAK